MSSARRVVVTYATCYLSQKFPSAPTLEALLAFAFVSCYTNLCEDSTREAESLVEPNGSQGQEITRYQTRRVTMMVNSCL